MLTFIREAGVGIYPVLIFGAVSVALACRYIYKPASEGLPLIIGFATATLLFSMLGFVLGMQASASFVENVSDAQRWLFVVGLRESLNNIVIGLGVVIIDTVLVTTGAHRFAMQRKNEARFFAVAS